MEDSDKSPIPPIMETPPITTKIAVILISLGLALGALSWFEMVNWQIGFSFAIVLLTVAILVYFLRALYRGRDGARLALAITVFISLIGLIYDGPPPNSAWEPFRFWFQGVVYTTAAILVYLPASNAWFRRHKPPKQFKERTPMDY